MAPLFGMDRCECPLASSESLGFDFSPLLLSLRVGSIFVTSWVSKLESIKFITITCLTSSTDCGIGIQSLLAFLNILTCRRWWFPTMTTCRRRNHLATISGIHFFCWDQSLIRNLSSFSLISILFFRTLNISIIINMDLIDLVSFVRIMFLFVAKNNTLKAYSMQAVILQPMNFTIIHKFEIRGLLRSNSTLNWANFPLKTPKVDSSTGSVRPIWFPSQARMFLS